MGDTIDSLVDKIDEVKLSNNANEELEKGEPSSQVQLSKCQNGLMENLDDQRAAAETDEKEELPTTATAGDCDSYWGFSLFETYMMAMKFYRDNEGKRTFTMTYDDKVFLAALTKQVSSGPYANQTSLPEVGYLDLFGRDRRKVWDSFADMSSNDARRKFIEKLSDSVPVFAPFMVAHQKEKEENERLEELKRKEEEAEKEKERLRLAAEEEKRLQLQKEQDEQEKVQQEQQRQKQQLMAALNAQTHAQFQQYAAQQHPGNPDKQAQLISLLQEQHYQQYIMLCMQQQQQQLQQQQGGECSSSQAVASSSATTHPSTAVVEEAQVEQQQIEDPDEDASDEGSEESAVQIAEASIWTRPQIDEFKQQIKRDPDSVLVIGRGEVVTIRVPTHEEGAYVFWEFATDHYDLGFGVMFEWTDATGQEENYISVQHGETTDEDTEDEDPNDPERGIGDRTSSHPPIDEIVPVYRRDSHVEIHAGSHRYPGRGVYLLKFDNSYSLWRSKTLYYRVYNTR